mgnify:CR=1 FL=1
MNEKTLTDLLKFQAEIDSEGGIKFPREQLKLLREKGFKNVQVVMFGSAKDAASEKGVDAGSYELIRNLQSLPDSVALDFLNSRGKLSDTGIKERITF